MFVPQFIHPLLHASIQRHACDTSWNISWNILDEMSYTNWWFKSLHAIDNLAVVVFVKLKDKNLLIIIELIYNISIIWYDIYQKTLIKKHGK